MKKIFFKTRLEAVEWIAAVAQDEGLFEVMRENLMFNYIYTGKYFLDMSQPVAEVVMIDEDDEEE